MFCCKIFKQCSPLVAAQAFVFGLSRVKQEEAVCSAAPRAIVKATIYFSQVIALSVEVKVKTD